MYLLVRRPLVASENSKVKIRLGGADKNMFLFLCNGSFIGSIAEQNYNYINIQLHSPRAAQCAREPKHILNMAHFYAYVHNETIVTITIFSIKHITYLYITI